MAKSRFTKQFQKNLEDYLREYIHSKPLLKHLEVHSEYNLKYGGKKNYVTIIDIAIIDPNSKGHLKYGQPESIVALEIEMFNNPKQIFRNYNYFKNYISGGSSRVGGLIMLFSDWANINQTKISELAKKNEYDQLSINGFKGIFHNLEIHDFRKNKIIARELIKSSSFEKILKKAIKHSLGINFR
jgi:hypothetical protein